MRDGWIEVTEEITVTVRAEGNRIRRGIYRDIPLEYYDRLDMSATRSRLNRCWSCATTRPRLFTLIAVE